MRTCVPGLSGRLFTRALIGAFAFAGAVASASAQTTVTLNHPDTQVVWATVRGGTYADKNDQSVLATRSSDSYEYNRRALLKFDTENTIPKGSSVTSAVLTMTVKTGGSDSTRTVAAYQTSLSWSETEVTWNRRRSTESWNTPGGDYGSKLDDAVVGNAAGTKVTFDVTALVKAAVAGTLGSSRYTRIALVDKDASTADSYREYYLPSDSNTAVRPTLKVTYGGTSTTTTTAPTTTTSGSTSTLRVLHWNIHHGGLGTDGVWDPARIAKWIAKFNPDIISLNEMERNDGYSHNTDEPVTMAALLKTYTGRTWYWKFYTLSGGSNGIGCMILSRFPLNGTETKLLTGARSAVNFEISVNGRTINFTSTHLNPDSSTYRKEEINQLVYWETGMAQQRIIAGDFNATYTSTEHSMMKQTYYDSWAVAQANGTDIAYAGNESGATRNGRIDFIYYSHSASNLVLKSSQVYDTRDSNGYMPSDHRPLMSVFTVK
jgi:endonuclease/exonuclease/phosphatase family metal-dependent hydrolase